MKIFRSLVIGSLLIALVVVSPLSVSAHEKEKGYEVKGKVVLAENNSIWNRITKYFRNNRSANVVKKPIISGISAPTVLKTGETGTWTISASDPQKGALSYSVDWGDKSSISPLAKTVEPIFVQTGTFTHAYSNPGTYNITFTVSNSAGFKTISKVNVRVTGSVSSPVINNLLASEITSNQAVLTWSTNVRSDSKVWFSKTSPVNTSGSANIINDGKVFNHRIKLNNLEPNTKYYVVVSGTNNAGMVTSGEISFTTLAVSTDTTAPVISNLSAKLGSTTGTVSWKTNEKATSIIYYSTATPVDINASTTKSVSDNSLKIEHSLNISGLAPSTLYHFIIKSTDASNNTVTSSEGSFVTTF